MDGDLEADTEYEAEENEQSAELEHSPNGKILVSVQEDGTIYIWDMSEFIQQANIEGPNRGGWCSLYLNFACEPHIIIE